MSKERQSQPQRHSSDNREYTPDYKSRSQYHKNFINDQQQKKTYS